MVADPSSDNFYASVPVFRGFAHVVEQDRYLRTTDTFEDVVAAQRRNREYLETLGI